MEEERGKQRKKKKRKKRIWGRKEGRAKDARRTHNKEASVIINDGEAATTYFSYE